jgi:hypothetical protein
MVGTATDPRIAMDASMITQVFWSKYSALICEWVNYTASAMGLRRSLLLCWASAIDGSERSFSRAG